MKTPMQELRDHIYNMVQGKGDIFLICVVNLIDEVYLEKEKQVIIDAVKFGNKDAQGVNPILNFEQYYNQTFNQ